MDENPFHPQLDPAVREFLDRPHRLLIGGQWIDAQSGETFETLIPAPAG
jgi:phenylacetaldehyde dehydrogenase